jgi:hypothetical protein
MSTSELAPRAAPEPPPAASHAPRARGALVGAGPLLVWLLATLSCAWWTWSVDQWFVMTDELLHVKAALSMGEELSLFPSIHGEPHGVFPPLYPLLAAPVFALLDAPSAFRVMHVLNATIMASTVVPAYLLAREVVRDRAAALLVAATSVAVPWMALSLMLMTEVAAYPAFVWAALALQRALARPGPRGDLLALGALLLAFSARTQFVVLALVLPVAVVAHEVLYALSAPRGLRRSMLTGLRRSVGGHVVLAGSMALAALAALPLLVAGRLGRLLGPYEVTIRQGDLLPSGLGTSLALHIDYVAVGAGVVPAVLALAWILGQLTQPAGKAPHAFAVLCAVLVPALAVEASSFNLRFAPGIVQDRYLFYVVPLLLTGMAAALCQPRLRWWTVALATAALAALIPMALYVPTRGPFVGSPSTAVHSVLGGRVFQVGELLGVHDLLAGPVIAAATVAFSVALLLARRFLPRRPVALGVIVLMLVYGVAQTGYTFQQIRLWSSGGLLKPADGPDWIDRALGPGAEVGIVPSTEGTWRMQRIWWDVEFWNRAVRRSYALEGGGIYTPFPARPLRIDWRSGRLRPGGPDSHLVVHRHDRRLGLDGRLVRRHASGLDLVTLPRPWRARWATRGIAPQDGTIAGELGVVRVFGRPGAPASARTVTLTFATGKRDRRPRSYVVSGANRAAGTVVPGEVRRRRLRVCVPAGGVADLLVSASPTPAPGAAFMGLRVARITVGEPGACPLPRR